MKASHHRQRGWWPEQRGDHVRSPPGEGRRLPHTLVKLARAGISRGLIQADLKELESSFLNTLVSFIMCMYVYMGSVLYALIENHCKFFCLESFFNFSD